MSTFAERLDSGGDLVAGAGLGQVARRTAVSPSISVAACSAMSPSMSLIVTCAPSAANSSAVARPMPRAEPVMIAAFAV